MSFFFFFFFKQKTAYEMRISDWSSDVCSSDLAATGLTREVAEAAEFSLYRFFAEHGLSVASATERFVACAASKEDKALLDLPAQAVVEIGRASCRERVGQYV